ncbi:MAG: aminotransferase class IV [Caulobacterales bacterium]
MRGKRPTACLVAGDYCGERAGAHVATGSVSAANDSEPAGPGVNSVQSSKKAGVTVAAVQLGLQKPEWIFANRAVRPWDDAHLHVCSEATQRGLNVFEGTKAFWQIDGRMGIVALRAPYDRLHRSAGLMHIPFDVSYEACEAAHFDLINCLARPDSNMWFCSTLFLTEGRWGVGDKSDLVIAGYQASKTALAPMQTGIATWRRNLDNSIPWRAKSSCNYIVARFAKIEGRERGYPEMILLNDDGRVAEFIGSALLMVRGNEVVTPPVSEGAFESITVDLIEAISLDMGLKFSRRSIDRTELTVADEVGCCGTLNEVTPVRYIDTFKFDEAKTLLALRDRYLDACTVRDRHSGVVMSTTEVKAQPFQR